MAKEKRKKRRWRLVCNHVYEKTMSRASLDILTFQPTIESLEAFLQVMKPTNTPSSLGPWLSVYNGMPPPMARLSAGQLQAYTDLITECETKCLLHPRQKTHFRNECREKLLHAAILNNDVGGKWIIFPFARKVDEVWKSVAQATWEGELTHHAKVATTNATRPQAVYPICIYVPDLRDADNVQRVLRKLQALGWVKRGQGDGDEQRMEAYFKPDVFTRVGMYHHATEGRQEGGGRGLRMDPVLYRIEDFAI